MNFFERNKALIITTLLFGIVILGLVNIKLSNSNKDIATTLIDLENFQMTEPEEPTPQKEDTEPSPAPRPSSVRTHQAYNQDQQTTEDIDSRLNEIFERNSTQSTASEEEISNTSSGTINFSNNTSKEKQIRSDGNNTTEEASTQSGNIRNSSISFSLVGRNALTIPNPIYTCDRTGRIVVNITVNSAGKVTSTEINEASSSSTNECLTRRALEYAAGAVFSKSTRNSQIGTISYNFQG